MRKPIWVVLCLVCSLLTQASAEPDKYEVRPWGRTDYPRDAPECQTIVLGLGWCTSDGQGMDWAGCKRDGHGLGLGLMQGGNLRHGHGFGLMLEGWAWDGLHWLGMGRSGRGTGSIGMGTDVAIGEATEVCAATNGHCQSLMMPRLTLSFGEGIV